MLRCTAQCCADRFVVKNSAYQLSSKIEFSIIPDHDFVPDPHPDTDPPPVPDPVRDPHPDTDPPPVPDPVRDPHPDPDPYPGANVATAGAYDLSLSLAENNADHRLGRTQLYALPATLLLMCSFSSLYTSWSFDERLLVSLRGV